jgi:membrane-bound lytic murein transglycosylase F
VASHGPLPPQHAAPGRLPRARGQAKKPRTWSAKRGVIEESVADYLLSDRSRFNVPIERLSPGTSTAELLQQVAEGPLDCALVESTRYALARRFFPQLEVAFSVGKPVDYAWLVSTVDKKRILDAATPFFERIRKDGTLKRLVDRYYGHALRMSAIDSGALIEKIATVLPRLKPHFLEAERVSGIGGGSSPPSYQESRGMQGRPRPRACAA